MAEAASPEPLPGMPKRRPAAVSRLTVPNDPADAQHCPGIPSCHSDAERGSWRAPTPPVSAQQWRGPRLSKPGYQPDHMVYHKVVSIFMLLLLVAVTSVSTYRQRQLASVVSSLQQKHKVSFSFGPERMRGTGVSSARALLSSNVVQRQIPKLLHG
jgi:hypothetical protein